MRLLRTMAARPRRRLDTSACPASARTGLTSDVPRNETLIVENPEGTIKNAGWFNIWAVYAGGQSTQPSPAHDGDILVRSTPITAWTEFGNNSLAAEPPFYNADFTEMTVKLRPGSFGATASNSPPTT